MPIQQFHEVTFSVFAVILNLSVAVCGLSVSFRVIFVPSLFFSNLFLFPFYTSLLLLVVSFTLLVAVQLRYLRIMG